MRTLAALLSMLLAGCASVKAKTHTFFCIGACLHTDTEAEKKKGEVPKDLAPQGDAAPND